MGKLICDSTTSSPVIPWRDPTSAPSIDTIETVDLANQVTTSAWENVSGLEDQQRRHLQRLHAKGVLWKHPGDDSSSSPPRSLVFRLTHGGDVEADGNCLFTASQKAMGSMFSATDLRRRTVNRFLEDLGSVSGLERDAIDAAIKHMYSPDLRELAAESIYKERCNAVDDGLSWAKYMSISGSPDDEYDIITLQYTEEGLLTVDENREGHAAAFGDDIAIECLATEFKREIYVVQAHGSDAMVDEENCIFFLPHRPRSQICDPPFFLFMKGTGWCGAGADHYEPLIAHPSSLVSQEKVAVSFFFSSKCLFIVGNVIIVFLVGESKFSGSFSSLVTEIYDEYVERSQSLQASSMLREKKEGGKLEMNLTDHQENLNMIQEEKHIVEKAKEERIKDDHEEEEASAAVAEERDEQEEKEEESGLPVDELNRRVEDFIARVNRQRWLEDETTGLW
ncbi:hypothetical protein F0562_033567 [Nyssa sinensis]|uniref:DUF4408 domain-containing protein n=1 Tax=Nyssa sinensis TaxID=561372 RepID=A0A5J5AD54_9ASTE|nr:hypothetical protein F0562_033567 [Nyssa sinensis]